MVKLKKFSLKRKTIVSSTAFIAIRYLDQTFGKRIKTSFEDPLKIKADMNLTF